MSVPAAQLRETFPGLVDYLQDDDVDALAEALDARTLAAGERVLTQGVQSDSLLLIHRGTMSARLQADDETVELGARVPGSWVGELGMIEPGPASAHVDADEGGEVWVLTHAEFEEMLRDHPRVAAGLLEGISRDVSDRIRHCSGATIERDRDGTLVLEPADDEPEGFIGLIRRLLGWGHL